MINVHHGHNFAKAYGIDSVAGAVIFAALYIPLLLLFIRQAISRPAYVYIVIAFFSAVRAAAFVLRALLAGVPSDGRNLDMLIAFEVTYTVGFFSLLYSAYTLVLDRGRLSDLPLPDGPISRILRKPPLFRMALVVAVSAGIIGVVHTATGSTPSTGKILRKVSISIFFVLSILVAFQAGVLVRAAARYGTYKTSNAGFGDTHSMLILCIISLLLLTREAFLTATSNNFAKQNNEDWWYPFVALTEFVAVVMFAAPGLVPSRDKLPS